MLGLDELVTSDGAAHDWAEELADKLVELQREDGSWSNTNPRWWEQDPVLCGAYAVEALGIALRGQRD